MPTREQTWRNNALAERIDRLEKRMKEVVLLEQASVRDPDKTVQDMLTETIDRFAELDLPDELLPTVVSAQAKLLTGMSSEDVVQGDIHSNSL